MTKEVCNSYFTVFTLLAIIVALVSSPEVLGQCGTCNYTVTSNETWSASSSPATSDIVCIQSNAVVTLTADIEIGGLELCNANNDLTINGNGNTLTITGNLHLGNQADLSLNDLDLAVGADILFQNSGNIDVVGNSSSLFVEGCAGGTGNPLSNYIGGTDFIWCIECASGSGESGAGSPTDCATLNNPISCAGVRIPGEPDCTTCTSTITGSTGGLNVNSGDVVCVQGGTTSSPLSLTNVNMNGGALQICGGSTVQGSISSYNSGTLNVLTGGTFDITNSFNMNGGAEINVYGTLDMSGTYSMQNGDNIINTAGGSALTINSLSMNGTSSDPGHTLNIQGDVDITTLTVNTGNNAISLEEGGDLNVSVLSANNELNSFCTGTCGSFTINNSAQINQPISDDTGVLFCYQGGSFISGSSGQPSGGGDGTYAGSATEGCPANCNTLLPVSFISFEAEIEDNHIALHWQTASEEENSHFLIERSADGQTFETIGQVAGSGTTYEIQDYQWKDQTPLHGGAYYRLRQVDYGGTFSFSKVRYVKWFSSSDQVQVYPNPAQDEITVLLNLGLQEVRLQLYSPSGELVAEKFSLTNGRVVWRGLENLQGFYILHLQHEQFVRQVKVLFR